ncbi:hypothetical protein QO206_11675 [Leeuwenhoekiella aequorea]|uniref:Uncharacterized protein n=1 Tax=Leeuwenhoekiella aequorea TaxID=283736 RepID=A0A4Q0P923_9FLAO|nr:hypothetical protein [Leeuwenhoekiella aequorea]RXG22716.1 hypothetical protein DSM00_1818 [Leeuwenhoekiella aequorea]|tara:strand:- start:238 stop:492 length:255 start_codon:yes stop_codon:yes gene_type:complete
MKLFVDCKKAGHLCDKVQYKDASLFEKLSVVVHNMVCKHCSDYSERNLRLTKLINDPKCKKMPEDCKKRIQQELDRELAKDQNK